MSLNKNPEAMESFRQKIQSIAPLLDAGFEKLADILHIKHFKRGDVLLKEGEICKRIYFIYQGGLRDFLFKNSKELNVNFHFEGEVVSDFESFRDETPATFNIVALEKGTVYYITKKDATTFFIGDSSMHFLLFRFFQQLYFREENHSNSFKVMSAEERYLYLIKNKPDFLQRIPLMHLASYLGVSRETLNRIRKKLN
ncbi:MAG: Crp/Fnr family transcriptional regulator [Bacteroidetes bacterium]|nr:Crp/Fnr family transcriptional regulator [Bacteroidota bacterium]